MYIEISLRRAEMTNNVIYDAFEIAKIGKAVYEIPNKFAEVPGCLVSVRSASYDVESGAMSFLVEVGFPDRQGVEIIARIEAGSNRTPEFVVNHILWEMKNFLNDVRLGTQKAEDCRHEVIHTIG
jgi:hypothetical protein